MEKNINKMRILHSGTLDVNAGGPAMSTYLTLLGLKRLGVDAEIVMPPLSPNGRLRGEEATVHYSKKPIVAKFGYIPSLKRTIEGLGEYDIYHAQGIWLYHTYAVADVARAKGKPYLIAPRGMLYPQDIAMSNKAFKMLSLRWRLLNDLNHAACVHTTCEEEMRHCRNLGVTAPCCVIPNPVEIKDYPYKKDDNIFRLGYLGRLSPRKNVEALIRAFATLGNKTKDAELLIIGGGDKEYEERMRNEISRMGLKNVRFAGFLSGEEKDRAIASCSVLAMPSEFENLGNVILEGLVRRIPCIATKGVPWEELNTRRCGWWVDYSQEAITEAVRQALNTPLSELVKMGERGRRLMEERYSVDAVAKQMLSVYLWILGKGEKPDCIYTIDKQIVNRGVKCLDIYLCAAASYKGRRAA